MAKKSIAKKAKVKKVYSRKASTGIAAAPVDTFHNFNEYLRCEVDKKEITYTVKRYLKENLSKEDYKLAMKAPEWSFNNTALAATIAWQSANRELPLKWNATKLFEKYLADYVNRGTKAISNESDSGSILITKKTISEILKEKTSDFIADIEAVVDDWETQSEYSLFTQLKAADAAGITAKHILDYYTPQKEEIAELVNKKSEDLVEAYSYMPVKTRKKYLEFFTTLVDDAEKYLASKKATRKARKPKVKSAYKQVEKLTYQKEDTTFKISSIDPSMIVGARRIYVFNTKYKKLTELVSDRPNGFEVSGSTIRGIDVELSRCTTLRKPAEFLNIVLKKTINQINKEWSNLTTKNSAANGRMNNATLILRALDK